MLKISADVSMNWISVGIVRDGPVTGLPRVKDKRGERGVSLKYFSNSLKYVSNSLKYFSKKNPIVFE